MSKPLSDIDKKLISILAHDGRASLTDIGRALGITHVAVSKKLNKFIQDGYLKVQGLLNPKKFNLKLALVFAEVESPQDMQRLIENFEDCPRMTFLATLMGGFNFVAMMIAEDLNVLESITSICCIRRAKGIRRAEVMIIGELVKPPYISLKPVIEKKYKKPPCKYVDCEKCPRYLSDKCLGCPAIEGYRGWL
ncbi:MAG: Lrp/AsnC family transcriptional regulator [Candidatus Nezhaarchaeales archaeon]